jgi:hypothetical protein
MKIDRDAAAILRWQQPKKEAVPMQSRTGVP